MSPRDGKAHLHFTEHGDGSPTLVLTHGLAASGDTWSAQVEGLSPRYRTLTWDLRGHGASSSPDGSYVLTDLADDLRDVFDKSNTERAVILGHSAGGVIAMQFALRHPTRTAGLVLVGTASECNERAHQFYEDLATIAEQRGMASVHKRLGLGADYQGPAANPAAFAKVARCMGNLLHAPLTPHLGEIRCPTLIIVGEKDFLGAGGSVILSRRIAGSELHIVPERGHGIFLEDPATFNALVDRFLRAQ
jgi:pimeloyl-ACP methyl ester carboxylesterase